MAQSEEPVSEICRRLNGLLAWVRAAILRR